MKTVIKNSRYLIYLFSAVVLVVFSGHVPNRENPYNNSDFAGKWKWDKNDELSTFNIELWVDGNSIFGYHCISALGGQKVDCAGLFDDEEYTIIGEVEDGRARVDFVTAFSDSKGEAIITLDADDNAVMNWFVSNEEAGEYYFPVEATLFREY